MVKFKNSKLISNSDCKKLKSLSTFVLKKFFTENMRNKLKIDVVFKKNLFKDSNSYGNCVWEDTHRNPREFTIQLDPNQKISLLLNSLAHELVHVKQWAKGEYYELYSKPKVYKFNGKYVDTAKVDYWDTPWEIEAHGRAIGLVVQWARKEKLTGQNLVVEG
jgi:CTP:phosphocholine cytidylyltransferase-like protein